MVALLSLGASVAHPDPLEGLDIGASASQVRGHTYSAAWTAKEPQGLRRGLIQSGLLEQLNRAKVTPKTREGGLDPARLVSFQSISKGGLHRLAVFSESGRLSYLLFRVPAPLKSGSMFSKSRLRARDQVLESLGRYRLRATEKDRYGNVSEWRGRTSRGGLWVRYVPEEEIMWVLLHERSGGSR